MNFGGDLSFLAGGGEMGARTRAMDWSGTAIGHPATWPQSLKTAVSICLGSRHPIVVWWGNPSWIQFYNDAYISFLGSGKHPHFLGKSGQECWSEIWPVIGPMLEGVHATGEATWSQDLLLVLQRHLRREEAYFTFSYSPIRDDSGAIGGIFCACNETTDRVIGERRLKILRDLSQIKIEARAEGACAAAARTLSKDPHDIPFFLIYLLDENNRCARLVASSGVKSGSTAAPHTVAMDGESNEIWPLHQARGSGVAQLVTLIAEKFGTLPGGPWPERSESALIVPITAPGQLETAGFLVSGLSPRRMVDADYRSFLVLVAGHIGTSIANARAYEEERKRAEALAEIDRAKTTFFSNVSHEFRTPLTLMMGPLEDVLADSANAMPEQRARLELAHRNSLRLLKLVNTLLDFSRIEAGRIDASYEPVDLANLTAELASVFRSAIERAGMKLVIDCPILSEPVFVDRDMWEKIVLNLLSNAFKFTFEGEIEISLRETASSVELAVRDTGTGIPSEEIPHLFERFHRVKGARGRSYEGSGIGLALVQELVRLHGGSIRVDSQIDHGSQFIISIPLGKTHLPADRIEAPRILRSTAVTADAYLGEVLRWSSDEHATNCEESSAAAVERLKIDTGLNLRTRQPAKGQRIILADDNADMRDYVRKLLKEYEVEAVPDGVAALRAARKRRPDLILADVMMPAMDGFQLLRELRADTQLREIPVILLSARAGEESRIEGLQAGADDYLIKPFSARELMARVESRLEVARLRRESTEALQNRTGQFETLLNRAPLGVFLVDADFCIRELNPTALGAFGTVHGGIIGRNVDEIVHVWWQPEYAEEICRIFHRTFETGESYNTSEWTGVRADRGVSEYYEWRLDRILLPDGRHGLVCYFRDISERVHAEATRKLLLKELNHRIKNMLATVQAIAQQTSRRTSDPSEFALRFSGRIQSLARVHSLLNDSNWQGADLEELIRDQLFGGHVDHARLTVRGPAIRLGSQTSIHLALMLHELATNATKYGALASQSGWVTVSWTVVEDVIKIRWIERGGPPVHTPIHRGFGTGLIENIVKTNGGSAHLLCETEGITWEISVPIPDSVPWHEPIQMKPDLVNGDTSKADRSIATLQRGLTGRRFLVVEDEALIALDLADTLQRAGAEVVGPVGTEREALQLIENYKFDGALLDANLHGRSVDEVAAALTRRHIPFVFITGYGGDGLRTNFKSSAILSKPINEQQLFGVLLRLEGGNDSMGQPRS